MIKAALLRVENFLFKFIFRPIVVILFVFWMVPTGICLLSGSAIPLARDTHVEIKNDEMIVQGNMNRELVDMIHFAITKPHDKINTVIVASNGGNDISAFTILNDLANLGPHRVIVQSGVWCQSACIILTLDPNSKFEPADSATLMFHRGYDRVGPDTCIFCRFAHWEVNLAKDIVQGRDSHRQMYPWAEMMAPGLGAALARCTPDPFDTIDGRAITGREFKAFRDGHTEAVGCPSK